MADKKLTILDVTDARDFLQFKEYTKFEEFLIDIKYHLMNIRIFFRDIRESAKNLFTFGKEISYLRHWDYQTLFPLLKKFLVYTRDGILRDNIIVDQDEVAKEINETLRHIHNFEDAFEVYEDMTQEMLQKIKDSTGEEKEKLTRDWYIGANNFEQEEWNAIWDSIKNNGQKWWD